MAGESWLQTKCKKRAESYRVLVRKVNAAGHKGWPDLLLLFPNGVVVFVEMKNPNGQGALRSAQGREHTKIRKRNGHVYTCDSYVDFCHILDTHLNLKRGIEQ